jgi:hypothetical protein
LFCRSCIVRSAPTLAYTGNKRVLRAVTQAFLPYQARIC